MRGRRSPSLNDGAVRASAAAVELVNKHPELWSALNELTLRKPVDWPDVLRQLTERLEKDRRMTERSHSPVLVAL